MATTSFAGPGDFDPSRHAREAERRWGDSAAYRESVRRTGRYGGEQWTAIQDESESVVAALADLLAEGVDPSATAAMDLAEAHRRHIDRWFYPCDHALHVCLADMYIADPRFTAHFDAHREGLAAFLREAIAANAGRHGCGLAS